ncbi:uncharacterized protein LOC134264264, partial [Saccostrea cucullata]|uniref:uncharacterized protein LOC134264264 n=1 Tax=Saccostrea cuccullata TaxID=36930 RepID=UPI002ECFD1CB
MLNILVFLCILEGAVSLGPRCLSCSGVPILTDCNNIVECGNGEGCFTRKVTTDVGTIVYEAGCISMQVCNILNVLGKNSGLGKRDITNCYECCSGGNHTDAGSIPCNTHLCGIGDRPEEKCYQCAGVLDPLDCRTTGYCNQDE